MLFTKELASLVLLCGVSTAVPTFTSSQRTRVDSRDIAEVDATSSSTNSTTAILEPVLPPEVDPTDLSILALDPTSILAWAGSTNSSKSKPMLKRDTGVLSQANITFQYPSIPLDQSAFVSGVSCSSGTLTATLTKAAYTYAKKAWKGVSHIVFITAADGCGMDKANDFFVTNSIDFSNSDNAFKASGSSASYQNVTQSFNLRWGDIGTYDLRRSVDKRSMFELHPLMRRAYAEHSIDWSAYLSDLIGEAEDAPWEKAALLWKWGKEGGEEDDSYKKGEVASDSGHHKRSNLTMLDKRELDYGLALYCVECGFGGSAKIWGEIGASAKILPPSS
ncbi:hypothetical protein PMIN06_005727 [Paraphaeosphaeria minitans]